MRVHAILPVKLQNPKTRLAGALSQAERKELVVLMLMDVLDGLGGLDGVILVGPRELESRVRGYDFEFVLERERRGLNNAVKLGNEFAMRAGAEATLFVPADTPLLNAGHIEDILELGEKYSTVISPSRRGGTGILFRKPPNIIEERFTDKSFQDHIAEAKRKGIEVCVYDSYALSLDIDVAEDIEEFLLHGAGTRSHKLLSGLKVRR